MTSHRCGDHPVLTVDTSLIICYRFPQCFCNSCQGFIGRSIQCSPWFKIPHEFVSLLFHVDSFVDPKPPGCTIVSRRKQSPQRIDIIPALCDYFLSAEKTVHSCSYSHHICYTWRDSQNALAAHQSSSEMVTVVRKIRGENHRKRGCNDELSCPDQLLLDEDKWVEILKLRSTMLE